MARLARVVVPGMPHHVTQRGNRRQKTFFRKDDYAAYLELVAESCARCGVAVWRAVPEPAQNVDLPPIRSDDRADGEDGEQGCAPRPTSGSRRARIRWDLIIPAWGGRTAGDRASCQGARRWRSARDGIPRGWARERIHAPGGPAPLRDGVLVRLGDFEGRLPRPAERVAGKTPVSTLSRGTRLGRCRSL